MIPFPLDERYYRYGRYLRERFQTRVIGLRSMLVLRAQPVTEPKVLPAVCIAITKASPQSVLKNCRRLAIKSKKA